MCFLYVSSAYDVLAAIFPMSSLTATIMLNATVFWSAQYRTLYNR